MNRVKGEAPLVLSDGRAFTVVLDMESLVEAEVFYGKPLPKVFADASAGFIGANVALLQAALSRHHEIDRATALDIYSNNAEAVANALEAASASAFPENDANVGNARPKPSKSSPRGKTSGGSGAKRA